MLSLAAVQSTERTGAVAQQLWVLTKQLELRLSVDVRAGEKIVNSKLQMVVNGGRSGVIEHLVAGGVHPDPQLRILGDAKCRVERAHGLDCVPPHAQVACNEVGIL